MKEIYSEFNRLIKVAISQKVTDIHFDITKERSEITLRSHKLLIEYYVLK